MNKEKFYDWWFSEIRFCGCGAPSEAIKLIRDYLINALNGKMFFDDPYLSGNERTNWFVLYSLDAWGLLEHGGGVCGSWLTDNGHEMCVFLASLSEEEIETLLDNPDEKGVVK